MMLENVRSLIRFSQDDEGRELRPGHAEAPMLALPL